MINIEVRFGNINGNAISVDPMLNATSENPVQNQVIYKELEDIKRNYRLLAGKHHIELVNIANHDELLALPNPKVETVYKTIDTNDLYVYNKETSEYVLVTRMPYKHIIYVRNIDELTHGPLNEWGENTVGIVEAKEDHINYYVLTYSRDLKTLYLVDESGWAEIVDGVWLWHKYSYEGHTHSLEGLTEVSAALQDNLRMLYLLTGNVSYTVTTVQTMDDMLAQQVYTDTIYIVSDVDQVYLCTPEKRTLIQGITKIKGMYFVRSLNDFFQAPVPMELSVVPVIEVAVDHTNYYVMTTSYDGRRYLVCKEGWALDSGFDWEWHKYSLEGHTHTLDEMPEIRTLIEKFGQETKTTTYTLDFSNGAELVQVINMDGNIHIKFAHAKNVKTLYLSYGNDIIRQVVDLDTDLSIAIPAYAELIWEIDRIHDGELAAVGIEKLKD